jgi:hypothetical protein
VDLLSRICDDSALLNRFAFSNEAIYHASRRLSRHKCRIWRIEDPHGTEVKVWCILTSNYVPGPISCTKATAAVTLHMRKLKNYTVAPTPQGYRQPPVERRTSSAINIGVKAGVTVTLNCLHVYSGYPTAQINMLIT